MMARRQAGAAQPAGACDSPGRGGLESGPHRAGHRTDRTGARSASSCGICQHLTTEPFPPGAGPDRPAHSSTFASCREARSWEARSCQAVNHVSSIVRKRCAPTLFRSQKTGTCVRPTPTAPLPSSGARKMVPRRCAPCWTAALLLIIACCAPAGAKMSRAGRFQGPPQLRSAWRARAGGGGARGGRAVRPAAVKTSATTQPLTRPHSPLTRTQY